VSSFFGNSITLEKKSFDTLMPAIVERPCEIIDLFQSDGKAVHTASEKN
jgi:hypothetical protein